MSLDPKPSHAGVKNYYAALHQVGQLHVNNEAQGYAANLRRELPRIPFASARTSPKLSSRAQRDRPKD
jgi:hypothetical protein